MSDPRPRQKRTQMAISDLGNAAFVKTISSPELAKLGGAYQLGVLLGKVDGVVDRTDKKDGSTYEGLSGLFLMCPADGTAPELFSGVLFIPDGPHEQVASKFRAMKASDKGAVIEFAFELSSVPDKSPQGYSWKFKPLFAFVERHLLDDTIASVGKLQSKK